MAWVSDAWDWYIANRETAAPLLAPLGSVFVGMGTIIVGGVVAWSALRQARTATDRHREQTRADQQRRLTESFSKAVEQLSSDKTEARLGGIYTLERLAIEAIAQVRSPPGRRRRNDTRSADPVSDLYWTVMETLTAFVRERARWEEPEPPEPEMAAQSDLGQSASRSDQARQQPPTPATDIAAVLEVLRRRPDAGHEREWRRNWCLDLRMTDLRGAALGGAHLNYAFLREAHLEGAELRGADLSGAILNAAHLQGARFAGAQLKLASLRETHLERADLRGAKLERADLRRAHLQGADLRFATGDAETGLPAEVARPADWPPFEPPPYEP